MRRKKDNFLDYIPRKNSLYNWSENKEGQVEICVPNRGIFCRIAQIFFQKPKETMLELDKFGSFVWEQIDGKRSIYEIGKAIRRKFGEEAEPFYERLARFIRILHESHFVVYSNKIKDKK